MAGRTPAGRVGICSGMLEVGGQKARLRHGGDIPTRGGGGDDDDDDGEGW